MTDADAIEYPDPAEAVVIWRKASNSRVIPETGSQVVIMHRGEPWIGLYRDGVLVGTVAEKGGVWAAERLRRLRRVNPVVWKHLVTAHGAKGPGAGSW